MSLPERVAVRDRPPTSIALILDTFWRDHREVIAIVLVDGEGECIDYCTSIDPYAAKVAGATWLDTTMRIRARAKHLFAGELRQWVLETERDAFVIRRVTDEHVLVVQLVPEGLGARHLAALDRVVSLLREDIGADLAAWDCVRDPWIGGSQRPKPGSAV